MSDLLKLADRCEVATGPDREIDMLIWIAVEGTPDDRIEGQRGTRSIRRGGTRGGVASPIGKLVAHEHTGDVASYTASLDAAMTLVPEGLYGWSVHRYASGTRARAGVYLDDGKDKGHYVSAATPALALCAAALRARAAQ